jgi:alpha-N-arabinofuranosidase
MLLLGAFAFSQNQSIYTDSLQNGWQSYGWATLNYSNTSPVHSGADSISVNATAYQALYLHHAAFDPTPYASLQFWINGGSGGQRFNVQATVNGNPQPAVALGPLAANTWTQVTLTLSQLGVAGNTSFDGFWIQDSTGTTQPTWYVDDAQLVAQGAPPTITLAIDATRPLQTIDPRMFAVAGAVWDNQFNTAATVQYFKDAGLTTSRFPGGSLSDSYNWQTNTTDGNTWTWATSFDSFANAMKQANCDAFITTNYGSGTSDMAAQWVQYSNVTKGYGFKNWEIGNECYGSWENDIHSRPHDPYTYAQEAANYIAVMKAVDPSIRVGVVATPGEDSYANYTDHPATNLRTGTVHNGWTAVMLQTLRQLGVTPDFIIHHRYEQGPGSESDSALLQAASTWPNDVNDLRQQLGDYMGAQGANVLIICT